MNTEELRAKVADVLRTRAEGWFIGAFDYDPIIEAVPSLLDEIDRLLEAYRTVCDYAETADALVAEVADLRAVRGHWQSVAMEWAAVAEERVAEVAALRRQIEAVEAERDAQLQRAARWQHVAAEALRATYCDAATPEAMAENVIRAINSAQRCDRCDRCHRPLPHSEAESRVCVPGVPAARDDEPRGFVDAATIYACFDAGHDVGLRHEDGSLYSATCHDCGHRYHRNCPPAPAARDEPEPEQCPTPCDDDCDAGCHEAHEVPVKRDHDPASCPGVQVTTPEDKQ